MTSTVPQLNDSGPLPTSLHNANYSIGRARDWEQFEGLVFSTAKQMIDGVNSKHQHVRKWISGAEERERPAFYTCLPRKCSTVRVQTLCDRNRVWSSACSVTPSGSSCRGGLSTSGRWPQTEKKTSGTPPKKMSPDIPSCPTRNSQKVEYLLWKSLKITFNWSWTFVWALFVCLRA